MPGILPPDYLLKVVIFQSGTELDNIKTKEHEKKH